MEKAELRPKEKARARSSTRQTTRGEDRGREMKRSETIERSHRTHGEIEKVRSVSITKGENRAATQKTTDSNKQHGGRCRYCYNFGGGPIINTSDEFELEFSGSSRAELESFNFRAESELKFFFKPYNQISKFSTSIMIIIRIA